MKALLSVELRRILARRVVRIAAVAGLLAILIAGGTLFARSHRLDPAARRALEQQVAADHQAAIAACVNGEFGIPVDEVPPGETLEQFCRDFVGVPEIPDPTFHLIAFQTIAVNLSGLFIVLFAVLGATLIGAEWHAGTITTELTWEPRRARLHLAKVLAAAAFALVGFVALQVLVGLAVTPAAVLRGVTRGMDASWLWSTAGVVARGAVVAALAAAAGASIAFIGRGTAVAVGVLFVYLAVLEPMFRGVKPWFQRWAVYDNAARFIMGQTAGFTQHGRTTVAAGVLIGMYVGVLAAASLAAFQRRDVT